MKKIDKKLEKKKRVAALKEARLKSGPTPPASVNTYRTNNKLTYSKSGHTFLPTEDIKGAPQAVNNLEVCKPVVAKSLNEYSGKKLNNRNLPSNVPAVNGEKAPQLVHKTLFKPKADYIPVIDKGGGKKRSGKTK